MSDNHLAAEWQDLCRQIPALTDGEICFYSGALAVLALMAAGISVERLKGELLIYAQSEPRWPPLPEYMPKNTKH